MLGTLPPGNNAAAPGAQTAPGMAAASQQNINNLAPTPYAYGALYRSSYAAPSSMSMPSSIPYQQPYYGPPPDVFADQQKASMVNALKGAQ